MPAFFFILEVSLKAGTANIDVRNVEIKFTVMVDSWLSNRSYLSTSILALARKASSLARDLRRSPKDMTEVKEDISNIQTSTLPVEEGFVTRISLRAVSSFDILRQPSIKCEA